MTCVVPQCRSYYRLLKKRGENTSLHRFPENHLREKWIDALGWDSWNPKKHHRICSKHFESDCFVFTNNQRRLLPNAIPTVFLRPRGRSHPNQQSGKGNICSNESLPDATSPQPLQGCYNQQLEGTDSENIVSSNERLLDVIIKTSPQPLQDSDTEDDKEIMAYTLGSHLNQQLEGADNEKILSGNEKLLDVIIKTSPQPFQESDYDLPKTDYDKEIMAYNLESHINQQSEDEDKKDILSGNENLPGAMPTTFPLPIQMTCQKCLSITRQYEEKFLKQDEEIKSLSSELEELKRLLEKSDKDLERVKEVSKTRLKTIWKLRKRVERNLIYPKDYILV